MLQEPVYTFNRTAERVIEFKGYNARGDIEDGEMRDMTNLTADEYPALYQRPPRSEWQDSPVVTYQGPRSLLVKSHFRADGSTVVQQAEKLAVIDSDGTFYYDGTPYLYGLSNDTKMVAINTKICFFPEKKFFRLVKEDGEDRIGDLDAEILIEPPAGEFGVVSIKNTDTLILPDGYKAKDYGFAVGDVVNVVVENPPAILVRGGGILHENNRRYDDNVFFICYRSGDELKLMTNIYRWRSESYVPDEEYDPSTWAQTEACKEGQAAIRKLKSGYDGFLSVASEAFEIGDGHLSYNSISMSNVTSIVVSESPSPAPSGSIRVTINYRYKPSGSSTWSNGTYTSNYMYITDYSREPVQAGLPMTSGVVQDVYDDKIVFGNNTFHKWDGEQIVDEDFEFSRFSVTRKSPDLDFVMEHNNRLWGVSNADNTIYACKLGDPTNWQYFQNTSLDSYYAEQGSDGEWTGCAPYSSHLCFFKEDVIHKVYGSYPSEFQIVTAICQGVESGSSDSLAFLNDSIFYKSRTGIMAYSGGYPENISREFGNAKYSNVVGGTDGRRYYASMEDEDGGHVLMCFDTDYNTWHKEDDLEVNDFAYIDGKLVYAEAGNPVIMEMYSSVPEDDPIEWEAVLGPYDEYIAEKKIYSRIKLRYKMPVGSSFKVYISADEGPWTEAANVTSATDRIEEVFVTPIRCDCFSIKIAGTGYCRLRSVVREYRTSTMRKEV